MTPSPVASGIAVKGNCETFAMVTPGRTLGKGIEYPGPLGSVSGGVTDLERDFAGVIGDASEKDNEKLTMINH